MNPYQSYAGSPPKRVPPRHPSQTQQPTQPAPQSTPVPQSMQRLSIPYLQSLSQQQLMQNKNPAAFDFITDPTKRIKLSQNEFAETGFKVDEAPRRIQALTRDNPQGLSEATEEVAQRPSNTDRRLVRPQPNIDRGTAPRDSKEAFDKGFKNSEIPSIRPPGNLEKANLPIKLSDSTRTSADMWNMPAFQQFLPTMETERSRDRSNPASNFLMKDDVRTLGLSNFDLSFPVMKGLGQNSFGNTGSGSDPLIMPELLDLMKSPHLDPQMKQNLVQAAKQQMLMQQLEQQKIERFLHQQQVFQQLQQQQHLDLLLQHQFAQQMQQKLKFENMVLQQMQDSKNRMATEEPTNKTPIQKNAAEVTNKQLRQLGSKPNILKEISNPALKGPTKMSNFKEQMEEISEDLTYSTSEMKEAQELKAEEGYTKIEEMEYSSTDKSGSKKASDDIKEEEKSYLNTAAPLKELKQQGRRRRSQNQTYDFGALVGAKNVAERAEPRRKNKWQQLAAQEKPLEEEFTVVTSRRAQKTTNNRNTTTTQSRSTRRFTPVEVELPSSSNVLMESEDATKENLNRTQEELERQRQIWIQEVENEVVDYNHLLNLTITNEPEYTGSDNTNQNFVVVYKDEIKAGEESEGKSSTTSRTRRGERYQAAIPEIDLTFSKGPIKRKHAELVWNPKAINENDLRRYLNDLCKALNCESINEERALKLLKRKNYKKDKVKVNISKNEKFYHSFLTVPDDPTKNPIEDNNKIPLQTNL